MRITMVILRVLCGLVDTIIVMAPIQFIMLGIFGVSMGQAEFLFSFLYAVYGALLTEYWGQTVGKYFGKIRCVSASGGKAPILYVGLRELVKSMYFIPFIGGVIGLISLIMMIVRKDGRALHDLVGNTKVVSKVQAEREMENEHK